MGARTFMTNRCTIEREVALGVSESGNPTALEWTAVGLNVPCRFWFGTGTALRTKDNTTSTITVHPVIGMLPLGTDIKVTDRISSVTDRRGDKLFGAIKIDAIERRKDHLSVIAEEIE